MIIESANPSVEYLFDYKPEDCVGQKVDILYAEGAFAGYSEKVEAAMVDGDERLCTEHILKKRNGDVFPAGVTTSFFRNDGRITKIIAIIRDITEHKG